MKAIHAIVIGRVQGVFFRDSARQQAQSLSITGWARNKSDGSVELVAVGESGSIDKLIAWLHQGPPAAKVEQVTIDEVDASEHSFESFIINCSNYDSLFRPY